MSERDPAPGPEPAASTCADRRAFVRLSSDLEAACRPSRRAHDPSWPARVRDISRGGVGLLLKHRFGRGIELMVELGAAPGRILRVVPARVVHATAVLVDGNPMWLLGCAFEEPLSEEEFQALQ